MASNGPDNLAPLHYALADAERIGECLSGPSCGFVVERVPAGASVWQVQQQLVETAESCSSGDVFICYFSGHGWLDRGSLYLMWDNTTIEKPLGTSIPVSALVAAMKQSKAQNKLLILDCCHAGTIVNMLGFKDAAGVSVNDIGIQPDNFVVLMASDRIEKARELKSLEGSFLTASLCEALSSNITEADKDEDNRISIEDLRQYLQDEAKQHNNDNPAILSVPIPYIFGQLRGDFILTVGDSDWTPFEFDWVDGITLVVTPLLLSTSTVLCMAKNPITNALWKSSELLEPEGKYFAENEGWRGPFYPWRTPGFDGPSMPVVCVPYRAAEQYCNYVTKKSRSLKDYISGDARLPSPEEWDYMAFGTEYPRIHPSAWLGRSNKIHDKSQSPALIETTKERTNARGISDMIGNVWEWCGEPMWELAVVGASFDDTHVRVELRGGGFYDDMTKTKPFMSGRELREGLNTSHSDLGFRLVAEIETKSLPERIQQQVSLLGQPKSKVISAARYVPGRISIG